MSLIVCCHGPVITSVLVIIGRSHAKHCRGVAPPQTALVILVALPNNSTRQLARLCDLYLFFMYDCRISINASIKDQIVYLHKN